MSYQVLARKWRPRNFSELVGQQQTAQALINALDTKRLHHAYLFTGTRGVGKTTIARIFSKSLNCESGITSTPCGECSSCVEIVQGNFVDLLEIDAASKTKVEDTRELLDNVQYRPTRGRYKIYLIDEVHMLSANSFNALLKTLEEPPPHVIFLLATTDPQKMPVTVLSRCLQFHLRRMEELEITEHLAMILSKEHIDYEESALQPIVKGADGSMRDALSLLDQAIAYCAHGIKAQAVLDMLGSLDREYSYQLLEAICFGDARKLMQTIEKIAVYSPDYDELLADWLALLHRLAVAQATGTFSERRVKSLSDSISAADIQLFYQLSLHARRDLAFAPHPRQGFEMAMLRIMAFKPKMPGDPPQKVKQTSGVDKWQASLHGVDQENGLPAKKTPSNRQDENSMRMRQGVVTNIVGAAESDTRLRLPQTNFSNPNDVAAQAAQLKVVVNNRPPESQLKLSVTQLVPDNWLEVVQQLRLEGNGLQILLNATAHYDQGRVIISYLSKVESLLTSNASMSIIDSLRNYFDDGRLNVEFISATRTSETPKEKLTKRHEVAIEQAERKLASDPQIGYLIEKLEGVIPRESILLKK